MTTNDDNKPSFFARYIDRPEKERPVSPKIQHAQKLLNWLQRWNKDTVSWRDIHNYGPRPIRDQKKAVDSAEILVRNGWLKRVEPHRYDMHKWRIVRRPPIVAPEVAT
jgi:hypothetical protein